MGDTLVGTAQAEDPLCKVFFFTKLAEAVPTEREHICFRSESGDHFKSQLIENSTKGRYGRVYVY